MSGSPTDAHTVPTDAHTVPTDAHTVRTVVFFHAHPDDEALLTAGTMAGLAAAGHRVVLVTATAGEAGLAASSVTATGDLGELRNRELAASATALGVAALAGLGYADSGMADAPSHAPDAFARISPEGPAERLARILDDERADAVCLYDPAGGYGHPDHRRVHAVGTLAARLAGTPVTLEATVDRRAIQRALLLAPSWAGLGPDFRRARFDHAFTAHERITHRVDVRLHLAAKRAAMAAHASQATGNGPARTLARFLRLPGPLFSLAFGREWYVEQGRSPSRPPLTDVLATLAAPLRQAHPRRHP